jgi:cholesterol oxidase
MASAGRASFDYDYIVVGSGFGGSVSAHRLTEKGYRVAVMEQGRRWAPGDFPKTNWSTSRWIWKPEVGLKGFFSLRPFKHVLILHGCAVGGGSITYANTLLEPPEKVWDMGSWAGLADWKNEMPAHYATASRMLGVVENKLLGPADKLLQKVADANGIGDTFYRTRVGVFQEPDGSLGGKTYPDPYFGGEGPERTTCIACGGCMIGCRFGAKNTLDLNYLYLAEKHGARVYAETKVIDVVPLGAADGSGGYEVRTVGTIGKARKEEARFTARGIVLAASALGTMELLFDLKDRGSMPNLSDQIGQRVRTNSESLIGVRILGSKEDLSRGVAIGSGIYVDEHTHIEATRYPAGSDSMYVLATLLAGGRPGFDRVRKWLGVILTMLVKNPLKLVRLITPFGASKQGVIFLCMQALEGHIDMRWTRPWFRPFGKKSLATTGPKVPTYIPAANDFAEKFAKMTGGTAMNMLTEILVDVPTTAHILGGCTMGPTPDHGVIDSRNRLFGYVNAYVCDGSAVSANLGVNPSLSITALTERSMSYLPAKADATWADAPVVEPGAHLGTEPWMVATEAGQQSR